MIEDLSNWKNINVSSYADQTLDYFNDIERPDYHFFKVAMGAESFHERLFSIGLENCNGEPISGLLGPLLTSPMIQVELPNAV